MIVVTWIGGRSLALVGLGPQWTADSLAPFNVRSLKKCFSQWAWGPYHIDFKHNGLPGQRLKMGRADNAPATKSPGLAGSRLPGN